MNEEISQEDREALRQYLGFGAPTPEEKHNVHTFLHSVATSDDTTKLGYLTEEEIGMPKLPIRSFKNLSLVAEKIMGNDYYKDYFNMESEIVTSTSLSRNAKLLTLAILQKREMEDVTKPKKENKGWFRKKKPITDLT